MEKFTILRGTTAPIELSNVDTDMIIPKQFLKNYQKRRATRDFFMK